MLPSLGCLMMIPTTRRLYLWFRRMSRKTRSTGGRLRAAPTCDRGPVTKTKKRAFHSRRMSAKSLDVDFITKSDDVSPLAPRVSKANVIAITMTCRNVFNREAHQAKESFRNCDILIGFNVLSRGLNENWCLTCLRCYLRLESAFCHDSARFRFREITVSLEGGSSLASKSETMIMELLRSLKRHKSVIVNWIMYLLVLSLPPRCAHDVASQFFLDCIIRVDLISRWWWWWSK